MQIKTNIEKSVLKTLAYYRALKTPLTLVQVGRYLVSENQEPIALSEIRNALNGLVKKGIAVEQKGLYWLKLDSQPPTTAWLKFVHFEKIAQQKIQKVLNALKLFSLVPFLRGLFICGSVARKVSRQKSDIDFLILTRPDRAWTVRLTLTFLAFLLGKKTNQGPRRNKFCLNHYRSSANLKLEESLQDLYSAEEYASMINIYSANRIDRKFFKKNKPWMRKLLPNFTFSKLPVTAANGNFLANARKLLEKMLGGKIGHIIEKLLYKVQYNKIHFSSARRNISADRRVVAEKEVIMFHLNPRAPLALNRYERILKACNL